MVTDRNVCAYVFIFRSFNDLFLYDDHSVLEKLVLPMPNSIYATCTVLGLTGYYVVNSRHLPVLYEIVS